MDFDIREGDLLRISSNLFICNLIRKILIVLKYFNKRRLVYETNEEKV